MEMGVGGVGGTGQTLLPISLALSAVRHPSVLP